MIAHRKRFPFGWFAPDEDTRAAYNEYFCLAHSCRLRHRLPHHHPLLQSLSGTYPVEDAAACWWPFAVAGMPQTLHELCLSLSAQEFRQGMIEPERWQAFRQNHAGFLNQHRLSSPRLSGLLGQWGKFWEQAFMHRGPADVPSAQQIIISTRPNYLMSMSNGRGWRSCQKLSSSPGKYTRCLPGNLYDVGVAVALLLPRREGWDTAIWGQQSIFARVTLRVMRTFEGQELVVLGNTYHNDYTSALWLVSHLVSLLERRSSLWGKIGGTTTWGLFHRGWLPGLSSRLQFSSPTQVQGPVFWMPRHLYPPFIDGWHRWLVLEDTGGGELVQLSASITQAQALPPHTSLEEGAA